MIPKQRVFFIRFFYILIDSLIVYFCMVLACYLREMTVPFDVTLHSVFFDQSNPFRFVFFFWLLAVIFLNNAYGLYTTRREIQESIEVWTVAKAVCLSAFLVIVAFYTLKIEGFPRSILAIVTVSMVVLLSVWRILKRLFVEYLVSRGYNNLNALIIGAGKVGVALAEEIKKKPGMGVKVAGFLDDFKENGPDNKDVVILGKISDFIKVARREFINKVFITIHHDSQVFLRLLEEAKVLGISVRVIPQGFELTPCEFSQYNIGFIPVLEYSNFQNPTRQWGKRLFDFCASLVALVFLIPVFIVLGVFIKLDSSGPVFYPSKRYGRKGKMFDMLKFRSMVRNADNALSGIKHQNEVDGPIFKMKDDPRITRAGRFLRRYSLDELPQFINVLTGEMSIVGPRPLPIDQVEREDLRQLKRLEVKPGITGLWQIRGRSDISFSRLVKWDIWYINNWSFWLDLNIILQTIPVVFKCKGAY